ncbi:hypothetical protein TUSST3_40530 [Streptomyces sp. TUS-ST3]|nr:hypothetical protein TUSST3_40530 [Streptomyces sp. TUS-ST3]
MATAVPPAIANSRVRPRLIVFLSAAVEALAVGGVGVSGVAMGGCPGEYGPPDGIARVRRICSTAVEGFRGAGSAMRVRPG